MNNMRSERHKEILQRAAEILNVLKLECVPSSIAVFAVHDASDGATIKLNYNDKTSS